MPSPLVRRIATAATDAQFDDFAPAVIAKVKLCLLDFLACAFEARDLPWSRRAAALAARQRGTAIVLATGQTASTAEAAFANAVAGHGLVREDMHAGSVSHLGVVVLPTLLALSQQSRVSGRDFIVAAITGYEAGARLGRVLITPEVARFFRPTGFTGPVAAACAGSRLLGLDEGSFASALALAANTASGLNQWPYEGGEEMFYHPGFAARNALTAIDLAELGAEGSAGALDGPAGLITAYHPTDAIPEITLFDGEPELLAVYNKPVPACNFAQTPCQAALSLVAQDHIQSSQIRAIRIAASYAAIHYPGCDHGGPFRNRLQAKMSIQFGVAAALRHRGVTEANYDDLQEAEILRLIALTTLETDPAFTAAFPQRQGSSVEILTTDGKLHRQALADVVPATESQIRSRFMAAAADALGSSSAAAIAQFVEDLENAASAGAVLQHACIGR
ncbi:MAG TPA: MmgE/PrpD family protein [Dongiaceae bacterium]|nr:MmgE/PrpD family protein [Dongiaceae bacterium]